MSYPELLKLAPGPAAGTAHRRCWGFLQVQNPLPPAVTGTSIPPALLQPLAAPGCVAHKRASSAGDWYRPVPDGPPVGPHKPAVLRRGSTRALTAAGGEWCTASPLSRGRRTACPCVCRRAGKGRIRNSGCRKASSEGSLQALRTTAGAQQANAPHEAG